MQALLQRGTQVAFVALLVFTWWAGRRPDAVPASVPAGALGFRLTEVARSVGIEFTHAAPVIDSRLAHIEPHVAGMGAAVALVDADGDGRLDVFATTSAPGASCALYLQQPDGRFRDLARAAGLADLNGGGRGATMGSVWADADRDGDPDAFVYRWGRQALFENRGDGTFVEVGEGAGVARWMNSNGAVWLDYDRDGWLDLFVTGYFREDVDLERLQTTRIMQESFEFAHNGGVNRLYRNLGGLRFEEVGQELGLTSTRWTLAAAAADLDGDGWTDLYVANDYGPEELFLNRGGERFELARGVGLDESSKSGMAVALGDFQNDGHPGIYVTNISKRGFLFQGNNLRINRLARSGDLLNVAEGVVADCGWSWGAQFGDLDNDGRQDLYVVNGFVSNSRDRDYWYGMSKIATAMGTLAEDALNWPAMEDRSLSGYERSRLLHNRGGMRFIDVAEAAGVSDVLDGRAVALGDLWSRGALDVVVANQRGPLLVYRNEVDPARHWIAFRLRGRASNLDAIGASVTLVRGAERQTQFVLAGSGFCAQNDLRLHFGLGSDPRIERALVRWPNGVEQELADLAVDALNEVEEP